jgi:hypothetical protein
VLVRQPTHYINGIDLGMSNCESPENKKIETTGTRFGSA